ncbi:hypothetical protein Q3G72_015198 [Acer saccharum]|nr:hypothetical protein Q3G72_015198 [Acer saccharum]
MLSKTGDITSKEAYSSIRNIGSKVLWGRLIWQSYIQPTQSTLLWRIILNCLSTDDNLKVAGLCFPSWCSMCNVAEDGVFHLFFHCQFANLIWEFFMSRFGINNPFNGNIISFINPTVVTSFSSYVRAIWIKVIACIFSKIWFEHNRRIFHDEFTSVMEIIGSTMAAVKDIKHFEVGSMYNSQAEKLLKHPHSNSVTEKRLPWWCT